MGVRMVKCRNCGGSGRAKEWHGYQGDCRVCRGMGKVPDVERQMKNRRGRA